jgi:xylulokinase
MITIGIDIGTSGGKVALVGEDDHVIAHSSQPLHVSRPRPVFSGQDPEHWWQATCAGLDDLEAGQHLFLTSEGSPH